jgi:Zn-finger nucleic acid-binding protein
MVDWLMRSITVGGGASERNRAPTRVGCPECFGSFETLLLTWSTRTVEIEQCPKCRTMMLDPGEFPRLFEIERDAPKT